MLVRYTLGPILVAYFFTVSFVVLSFSLFHQGAEEGAEDVPNNLGKLPRHHPLIKDSMSDDGEKGHNTVYHREGHRV